MKPLIFALTLTAGFVLGWPQGKAATEVTTREIVMSQNVYGDLKITMTFNVCGNESGALICTESRKEVTDGATLASLQTIFDGIETGIPEITATRVANAAGKADKLAAEKAASEAFMSPAALPPGVGVEAPIAGGP